jgi:outer membrane lipoprotein-sorting protein
MFSSSSLTKSLIAISALIVFTPVLPASAQEVKRDPKVQAIFDQMLAAYKAMPALQEKISMKFELTPPEINQQPQLESVEFKAQNPNKIALSYAERSPAGKLTNYKIISDGANVWTWRGDTNTYTKTKAAALFPQIPSIITMPDVDAFVRGKDPFAKLPIPANLLSVGQPTKLGDVEVDVVEGKVSQVGVAITAVFKMYFSKKDHTLRGVAFEGGGEDTAKHRPINFKIIATYVSVNPAPTIAPSDFAFIPPDGAKLDATPAVVGKE